MGKLQTHLLVYIFLKIFKRIIYRRLYDHIHCNHISAHEQFGFINNSPTETAFYKLITDILLSLNNKLWVGGIVCDLQKGFYCVCYNILSKMEFYGISGEANKLIQFYLNNRYQRVVLNNNSMKYFSKWEPVKHGSHKAQYEYLDYYFFYCILLIF